MQLDSIAEVASDAAVLQKRVTIKRILLTPKRAKYQPLSPDRRHYRGAINHNSDRDFECAAPATLAIIQARNKL
ncbi:MAG TPA: hypothetical protein VH678_31005 [Xanthobacteraceae bacterium]|jgi:hypothetical protein